MCSSVEKSIKLPRNLLAAQGVEFNALPYAKMTVLLVAAQSCTASLDDELPPATSELAINALLHAHAYLRRVKLMHGKHAITSVGEPHRATVDGTYCLPYAPLKDSSSQSQATKEILPQATSTSNIDFPSTVPAYAKCWFCCDVTQQCSHSTTTNTVPLPKSEPETAAPLKMFVPFIFAEHKRYADEAFKAINQMKLYCITGLEFLASIGITDFPVWGIVTAGSKGVILMAWKSSKVKAVEATSPNVSQTRSFTAPLNN